MLLFSNFVLALDNDLGFSNFSFIVMRVVASPEEHKLINTDPAEKLQEEPNS